MQQFDLSIWLKDKSRKVVTRNGSPVRIVCWDVKGLFPILALIEGNGERDTKVGEEYPCCYKVDGTCPVSDSSDIFFADEEEELTEFENTMVSFAHAMFDHLLDVTKEIDIKEWKDKLLDLARKEIEKDIEHSAVEFAKSYMDDVNPSFEKVKESEELWKWKMSCLRGINNAYKQGKQDALKDLPKWKYINQIQSGNHYAHIANGIISPSGYFISYDDLETLPKEE